MLASYVVGQKNCKQENIDDDTFHTSKTENFKRGIFIMKVLP